MFKLKKQLYLLPIVLFIFLGLFLINNHHQIMAMENESFQNKTNTKNKSLRINNEDKVIIKNEPVTSKNIEEFANNFRKKPHIRNNESMQRLINHLFLINELPLKDFDLACFKPPFDKG